MENHSGNIFLFSSQILPVYEEMKIFQFQFAIFTKSTSLRLTLSKIRPQVVFVSKTLCGWRYEEYLLFYSYPFILKIKISSTCAGILTMSFAVSILITILVLALVCGILYLVWKRRKGREGKKTQSKIRRKAMVSNCTFSSYSQLLCGEVDSDLESTFDKTLIIFHQRRLHQVVFFQFCQTRKTLIVGGGNAQSRQKKTGFFPPISSYMSSTYHYHSTE